MRDFNVQRRHLIDICLSLDKEASPPRRPSIPLDTLNVLRQSKV